MHSLCIMVSKIGMLWRLELAVSALRIVVFMSGRLWDPKAKDRISAHRDYMGRAIIMQWSPFRWYQGASKPFQDH